jgi:hypothetical protein
MAVTTITHPATGSIVATSWGIDVADTINNHTTDKLSRVGPATFTGALTVSTDLVVGDNVTADNFVINTAQTGATPTTRAMRIDYANAKFVNVAGGTMTGRLVVTDSANQCIRLYGTAPLIESMNAAQSSSFGRLRIGNTDAIFQHDTYGHVRFQSTGATLLAETGPISLTANGTAVGSFSTANFLYGKTATGIGSAGFEFFGSTSGVNGAANFTIGSATQNLQLNHVGTANVDAAGYIRFLSAGTTVSSITQDAVAPVGILISACAVTAPSDYRLKDDLGPITGALSRVCDLAPKHLRWKETGYEYDGFIAHEVAAVVPEAVRGDKDAVYDATEAEQLGVEPGSVKAQQLEMSAILPLVTAGLIELAARVETLEAG